MASSDDAQVIAAIISDALRAQGRGARTRLAEALHVSPTTTGRWASGDDLPDRARWPEIERALGLSAGTFAGALGLLPAAVPSATFPSGQDVARLVSAINTMQDRLAELEGRLAELEDAQSYTLAASGNQDDARAARKAPRRKRPTPPPEE